MGFQSDGGFVVTTGDDNYRYRKRVDEHTLKKIIELLDIPQQDRERLIADHIRTIHIFSPK